jgi:hypothetical protein
MRHSLWAGLICACAVTLASGCGGSVSENGSSAAGAAAHTTTDGASGNGGASSTSSGTSGSGGTSAGSGAGGGGGVSGGASSCGDLQIQAQAAADLTCQTDSDCVHPPHMPGDCTECGIVSNATSQQTSLAAAQAVCQQFDRQGCKIAQHSCPFMKTTCVAGACEG